MALNGSTRIAEATRKRVIQLAEEHGYRGSAVARSMREKSTKSLCLMLPDIINPIFPGILKGVEDVAARHGYTVIFSNFDGREENVQVHIDMVKDRWIDGVIYCGITGSNVEEGFIKEFIKNGIPVVFVDRGLEGHETNAVMIDNYDAGYRATEFLLKLGHRKIGYIGGPNDVFILKKRRSGYLDALRDAGIESDDALIVESQIDESAAEQAFRVIIEKKPTAIFVPVGDVVAISIQTKLMKHGFKIPDDFSILGFDDLPISSIIVPSLSTVSQPFVEMGREAAMVAISIIEGKNQSSREIIFKAKIVVRESTRRI
jgi:LacI family transcriptional regulator